jgi:hypothetical protein
MEGGGFTKRQVSTGTMEEEGGRREGGERNVPA